MARDSLARRRWSTDPRQARGSHIDERCDFIALYCFGNGRATPRVTDQHNLALLVVDRATCRIDISGQRFQTVLYRRLTYPFSLQQRNDLRPVRAVGEGAMNKSDIAGSVTLAEERPATIAQPRKDAVSKCENVMRASIGKVGLLKVALIRL